jgi:nitroreductase
MDAGLHHYMSRDHVLEHRWSPATVDAARLGEILPGGTFLVSLASIHWREAWKYGERAFRYCQHDAGHALATVRYAAAVLGWSARLLDGPGDSDIATLLGLDREEDLGDLAPADREHPDSLIAVAPAPTIEETAVRVEGALDELVWVSRRGHWTGRPSPLSSAHVGWPEIDTVASATVKPRTPAATKGPLGATRHTRAVPSGSEAAQAVALIRQRRSAVDMDGRTGLPGAVFFGILDRLLPRRGVPPWDVLPWAPRIHPVFFVHRVEGLAPGMYVLVRNETALEPLRRSIRASSRWTPPEGAPRSLPFFLVDEGDARSFARFASCQQAIASDSAFSLGMLSAFEASLREGPWWYRRLFWETGVLGQVLYMEAEATGARGTGIGCYFDDVVHEVLGFDDTTFRDLYHFTVGGAVEDRRLTTRPAYPAAVHARD